METTTPTAPPCLRCHNPGGYRKPHHDYPSRARGLCSACYDAAHRQGKLGDYPRTYHAHAAACLGCRKTFGLRVRHNGRGLCQCCYTRAQNHGVIRDYPACGPRPVPRAPVHDERPEIPTGLVTLASRGIRTDIPPTDPALTPKVVRAIGNLNARRAIAWLTAHTGIDETQALARVVWMPAQPDAAARRAA